LPENRDRAGPDADAYRAIKHNVVLSILGAFECFSCGLLIQGGALVRLAIEDSIALVDLALSEGQVLLLLQDKYDARKALKRVKSIVPKDVKKWYGRMSGKFVHMGMLHRMRIVPLACHGENWRLVKSMEGLTWAIVTFHVCLERVYFESTSTPWFWRSKDNGVSFIDDSVIFEWTQMMGDELVKKYPPTENKEGFLYSDEKIDLGKL